MKMEPMTLRYWGYSAADLVFAHLAQFQPAARTQLPKAGFPASAQPHIADLSTTVAKHAGKFDSQLKMGFPGKRNTEIISLEAPQTSGISTTLQDGKWPTIHITALFLI